MYLVVSDSAHFDNTITTNTMVHGSDRSGSVTEEDEEEYECTSGEHEEQEEEDQLERSDFGEDALDAGATLLADAGAMLSNGSEEEEEEESDTDIPETITPSKQQGKKWYSIHKA